MEYLLDDGNTVLRLSSNNIDGNIVETCSLFNDKHAVLVEGEISFLLVGDEEGDVLCTPDNDGVIVLLGGHISFLCSQYCVVVTSYK